MSFMETMGGLWQLKALPSKEEFENQSKIMEKLQVPKELADAIYEGMKNSAELPKAEFKDLGNGLYVIDTHVAGQVSTVKFTLDGKPTENEGPLQRKMMITSSFQDGVWKSVTKMDGCPDVFVERKRVGDEIHQTKTCDGITFTDVERKI